MTIRQKELLVAAIIQLAEYASTATDGFASQAYAQSAANLAQVYAVLTSKD